MAYIHFLVQELSLAALKNIAFPFELYTLDSRMFLAVVDKQKEASAVLSNRSTVVMLSSTTVQKRLKFNTSLILFSDPCKSYALEIRFPHCSRLLI